MGTASATTWASTFNPLFEILGDPLTDVKGKEYEPFNPLFEIPDRYYLLLELKNRYEAFNPLFEIHSKEYAPREAIMSVDLSILFLRF